MKNQTTSSLTTSQRFFIILLSSPHTGFQGVALKVPGLIADQINEEKLSKVANFQQHASFITIILFIISCHHNLDIFIMVAARDFNRGTRATFLIILLPIISMAKLSQELIFLKRSTLFRRPWKWQVVCNFFHCVTTSVVSGAIPGPCRKLTFLVRHLVSSVCDIFVVFDFHNISALVTLFEICATYIMLSNLYLEKKKKTFEQNMLPKVCLSQCLHFEVAQKY